jgi:PAS domain S-box-containing protein
LAVLETILLELSDVNACSILTHNPHTNCLELVAARGQADVVGENDGPYNQKLSFPVGEGMAGMVFQRNQAYFWDKNSPQPSPLVSRPDLPPPESLACLPLSSSIRKIGVLNVSFGMAKPFDYPRKRNLALLSEVVANVMTTFVLKEELEQRDESAVRSADESFPADPGGTTATGDEPRETVEAPAGSEERLRRLVDGISDGYFMFSGGNGRFLRLNDKICGLFGYRRDEALELTVWEIVAPEELGEVQERIERRLRETEPDHRRIRFTAQHRDGSVFPAEVTTIRSTHEGRVVVEGLLRKLDAEPDEDISARA